jgi:outer membrane protein OmpA-like peptidoglycan-associated protein
VDQRGWLEALDLGYGLGYRHVGFRNAASEEELGLGLAFPFTQDRRLNLGLALRALQSRLGVPGVDARGYGLDLGVGYHPPFFSDALRFGLAIRDFQSELNWSTGVDANPVQLLQAGVAWNFDPDASIEFDSEMASDPATGSPSGQGFKLGAERWWDLKHYGLKHLAALRLGYYQSSALAPSALGGLLNFGLGIQYQGLSVDYAFGQDVSTLGPTHRVSAAYRFGGEAGPRPSATPSPTPGTLEPAAPLSLKLEAAEAVFRPLSGAARQTLTLKATGSQDAVEQTHFEIQPLQGASFYAESRRGLPLDWSWDGRQQSGAWAAAGAYRAQISAVDAQGRTLAAAQASFRLDLGSGPGLRLLPEADIFAPIGQSERRTANLAVGYQGTDVSRWTLNIFRESAPARPLRILRGRKLPAKLSWDGFNSKGARVPDGGYRLQLVLERSGGGPLTAETRLDVDTRRPNLDLSADPKVFEPKSGPNAVTFGLGQGDGAGGGIPARWSLSVETLTGKKLKSFGGKGSPPPQVLWNGTDEGGKAVPGGALYYVDFTVAMESGALARLPRVTLASNLAEPTQPFKVTLQTLHFEEGEEGIPLEEFPGLREAAAAIKKSATDYVVLVGGYAAPGESGKAGLGELELSFLRAKSVRDFLVDSEGLPADKVKVQGHGAKAPAAGSEASPAARAQARSAEVIIYAQ